MKKKSSIIPFNCESILDLHTWTISNACLFLLLYKNTFTEEERDYLIKEMSRHEMKTKVSAYKFMIASANEIKNNRAIETEKARAFIEFMRIYEIAVTKFDIDSEVTPYQFISWAVTKRTIPVHQDLRIWLEEERSKKLNKTVVMRKALEEAKASVAELKAENDKLRKRVAELESKAEADGETEENAHGEEFPAEYEGHGLFTVVAKLVDARVPVVEIMAALDEEKEFLSQRENGYFFHPNPAGKSVSTLRNYTKNTLKKRVAKGS